MGHNSTHSTIHRRFKAFVKWIAPDPDKKEKIRKQSSEIIAKISAKAEADGKIIKSTPLSGSFPKESGLRRFMMGNTAVEGQDVDIAFILSKKDKDGNELGCQVYDFKKYARESYPDNEVSNTKSSATIEFTGSKLKYDLVPLFQIQGRDRQLLKRTDFNERKTSVKKHTDFSLKRKEASDKISGVVKFNECVRLVKWWRYAQQEDSHVFGNDEDDEKVPSFLLDLLCAKAYDETSVDKTYSGTLARWFGILSNIVKNRKEVKFSSDQENNTPANWKVLDPMEQENNVVEKWSNVKINELLRWLEEGRDNLNRAVRYDEEGEDAKSLECLIAVFGNSFKNHCD